MLEPLFEGAKTHFADGLRRIDRAHLVMLAETGIVRRPSKRARSPAHFTRSTATSIVAARTYTGEFEDYFFLVEAELKRRLGADLAGRLHTGRVAQRHRPHAVPSAR